MASVTYRSSVGTQSPLTGASYDTGSTTGRSGPGITGYFLVLRGNEFLDGKTNSTFGIGGAVEYLKRATTTTPLSGLSYDTGSTTGQAGCGITGACITQRGALTLDPGPTIITHEAASSTSAVASSTANAVRALPAQASTIATANGTAAALLRALGGAATNAAGSSSAAARAGFKAQAASEAVGSSAATSNVTFSIGGAGTGIGTSTATAVGSAFAAASTTAVFSGTATPAGDLVGVPRTQVDWASRVQLTGQDERIEVDLSARKIGI